MALNIFGDAPQSLTGLLGEQATEDLRKKAMTTGLINAAIGYIAQPKTMGYGSALPYIGRALMAGQQGAQGVYEGAITDFERQQKIDEFKRKQEQRKAFEAAVPNLMRTTPAQFESVTTPGGYAPQQAQVMPDQVAPNFGMTRLPDVTTQRQVAPARTEFDNQALMNLALQFPEQAAPVISSIKGVKELTAAPKEDYVTLSADQIAINPVTGKTLTGKEKAKEKWSEPFNLGGQVVQQDLVTGQIRQAVTQPSQTNVNVSTKGEGEFQKTLGTELAKKTVGVIDAGQAAPDQIASARRIKSVLQGKTFTGAGAEQLLGINNALATAGVIDPTAGVNTEMLMADMAKTTLQNIKSSGLGAGQGFSNADRDFLEKASAGKITLNAGTIKYIADLNERAGLKAIDKYNTTIKSLPAENRQYYNLQEIGTEQYRPKGRLR
jgi:hypothetical protein